MKLKKKSPEVAMPNPSYSILELRFIKYVSQLLRFNSINYDKKLRKDNSRCCIILDSPINENESLIDSIPYLETYTPEEERCSLEDLIEDPNLYDAVKSLTNHQKMILEFAYIKEMSDTEISRYLGVSQQSITKTRNTTLKKIRKLLTKSGVN